MCLKTGMKIGDWDSKFGSRDITIKSKAGDGYKTEQEAHDAAIELNHESIVVKEDGKFNVYKIDDHSILDNIKTGKNVSIDYGKALGMIEIIGVDEKQIKAADEIVIPLDSLEKQRMASDPKTPPDVLKRLFTDYERNDDDLLGKCLARNPNTPTETLDKLANDVEISVQREAAANPKTSPETLYKLSGTTDELPVMCAIAANPSTPVNVLEKWSNDNNYNVRFSVATNPGAPPDILKKLAYDPDNLGFIAGSVREAVAKNLNTPAEILKYLADDKYDYVRKGVAGNLKTPAETLKNLTNDPDQDVRAMVVETLKRLGIN